MRPAPPTSRTALLALRYWNIARQRHYRSFARCCLALRVSADRAAPSDLQTGGKPALCWKPRRNPGETRTVRWSGMDSNFQYAEAVKLLVGAFSCVDCLGRVGAPVGVLRFSSFFIVSGDGTPPIGSVIRRCHSAALRSSRRPESHTKEHFYLRLRRQGLYLFHVLLSRHAPLRPAPRSY